MRRINIFIFSLFTVIVLGGCCSNRPRPIMDCLCGKGNQAAPPPGLMSYQQPVYGAPSYVNAGACSCEGYPSGRLGGGYPIGGSYPGADGLPPGAIMLPPNGSVLPMPKSSDNLPRIPTPGIQESPGKQFELNPTARGVSRLSGPALGLPTATSR